jgi:hypothetical protein
MLAQVTPRGQAGPDGPAASRRRHAADRRLPLHARRAPSSGRFERDGRAEPTGALIDVAQDLLHRVTPRPTPGALESAVRAATADRLAVGLAGVHEMGADLEALAASRRLAERAAFPFRDCVALRGADEGTRAATVANGPGRPGDGCLAVGAVRLMADGALGSRGAAPEAPCRDDPGHTGFLLLPPDAPRGAGGAAS